MAIQFPSDPSAQTPVNKFSPDSTPLASPNSVDYTWDGEKWVAYSLGNTADFEDVFVEVAGDNMTGTLTMGPEGAGPPDVFLRAGDGPGSGGLLELSRNNQVFMIFGEGIIVSHHDSAFINVTNEDTSQTYFTADSNGAAIGGIIGNPSKPPEIALHANGNITAVGDIQSTSQNGGQLAGFRNQLINGDFRIWQRGTTVTNTGAALYTADRWRETGSNVDATVQQSPDAPDGFAYSAKLSADAGSFQYGVELDAPGNNSQFPIGSVWTLSVWANKDISTQVVSPKFRRIVGQASGSVNATVSANWSSTDETSNGFTRYKVTWTITGDASTNPDTTCLNINLPSGDSMGEISYAGVQLEPGPVATPFEHRPYAIELALCQRYFQALWPHGTPVVFSINQADRKAYFSLPLQPMRAAPTFISDFDQTQNVVLVKHSSDGLTTITPIWTYYPSANTISASFDGIVGNTQQYYINTRTPYPSYFFNAEL